jgi:hypothetical protein
MFIPYLVIEHHRSMLAFFWLILGRGITLGVPIALLAGYICRIFSSVWACCLDVFFCRILTHCCFNCLRAKPPIYSVYPFPVVRYWCISEPFSLHVFLNGPQQFSSDSDDLAPGIGSWFWSWRWPPWLERLLLGAGAGHWSDARSRPDNQVVEPDSTGSLIMFDHYDHIIIHQLLIAHLL